MEKSDKSSAFAYGDARPVQELGGGVQRKILSYGEKLMAVEAQFAEGSRGSVHRHPHTQLTYVLEGEFRFTVGEEESVVRRGDTIYMPPDIPHGCVCIRSGKLLDMFTPMRADFLPTVGRSGGHSDI